MPAKKNPNGDGTVYQRIDGRWCGSGYVLATDGSRKRVYGYGNSYREASDKLDAKLADSTRGAAVLAADPTLTVGAYLTTWLHTVARHRLRATTYATCESLVGRYLIPGLGTRRVGALTVTDVRAFIKAGNGTPVPDGSGNSQQVWKGRPGEAPATIRKWGSNSQTGFAGSPEWQVTGRGSDYRIIGPNAYGEYGYTSNHYGRISVATGC
jgi:integrase-like protein